MFESRKKEILLGLRIILFVILIVCGYVRKLRFLVDINLFYFMFFLEYLFMFCFFII